MTRATRPERSRSWMSLRRNQCFGICDRTPTKPMIASFFTCSINSTPAAFIWSPPTPISWYDESTAFSSRATPAAFVSPEVSPATNRISRTRWNGRRLAQGRQTTLDLVHDLERDGERLATSRSADGHRSFPLNRGDETLQLQPQRVALGRIDRFALDELLDRLRALRVAHECREIHPLLEVIELAGPRAEIE